MNDLINWGLLYALLSLDRVLPLYGALGVPGDPPSLQVAIRRGIVANRSRAAQDPGLANIEAAAASAIQGEIGIERFESFARWAIENFEDGGDRTKPWTVWKMIFQYLTQDPEAMTAVFGQLDEAVLSSYNRIINDAVYDQIEPLGQQPHTDWDSEMYARHAWSDDDPVNSPFNYVELTITGANFRRFFRAAVADGNSTLLFEYGKRLTAKLGLADIAPVVEPQRLVSRA